MIGATYDPALDELKPKAQAFWLKSGGSQEDFNTIWPGFVTHLINTNIRYTLRSMPKPEPIDLFTQYVINRLFEY